MLSYSARFLVSKKGRFIFTVLIIALVVGMYLGYAVFAYSYNVYLEKSLNIAVGNAGLLISNSSGFIDFSLISEITDKDYVEIVDYYLSLYGKAIKDRNFSFGVLYGIGGGFYWKTKIGDVELHGNETIVTADLADNLGADVGDKFTYIVILGENYSIFKFEVKDIAYFKKMSGWETARSEVYSNITTI